MRPALPAFLSLAFALACGSGEEPPATLDLPLAYSVRSPIGMHPSAVAVDAARDVLVVAFARIYASNAPYTSEVKFLRLSTGKPIRVPAYGDGDVRTISLTADGATAVTSGVSWDIGVHGVEGGLDRTLPCGPSLNPAAPPKPGTCHAVVSPDGRLVASLRHDAHRLAVLSAVDGSVACDLTDHAFEERSTLGIYNSGLAFAPDGAELAAAFWNGPARTFRVDGCVPGASYPLTESWNVGHLVYAADGATLLAADLHRRWWRIDRATGTSTGGVQKWRYGDIETAPAALAPDGRLWTLDEGNRIAVLDADGALQGHVGWGAHDSDPRRAEGGPDKGPHLDDVNDFALDASGRWLVAARYPEGSDIRVYRVE